MQALLSTVTVLAQLARHLRKILTTINYLIIWLNFPHETFKQYILAKTSAFILCNKNVPYNNAYTTDFTLFNDTINRTSTTLYCTGFVENRYSHGGHLSKLSKNVLHNRKQYHIVNFMLHMNQADLCDRKFGFHLS